MLTLPNLSRDNVWAAAQHALRDARTAGEGANLNRYRTAPAAGSRRDSGARCCVVQLIPCGAGQPLENTRRPQRAARRDSLNGVTRQAATFVAGHLTSPSSAEVATAS
jgi:hypothetical protein